MSDDIKEALEAARWIVDSSEPSASGDALWPGLSTYIRLSTLVARALLAAHEAQHNSTLTPRDAPSDEVVEAVARAINAVEFDDAPAADDEDMRDPMFRNFRRDQARAAIEAYQKATGGDPRGKASNES